MTQKHKSPKPNTNIIIAIIIFLVVAILTFFIVKIVARPHQPELIAAEQSSSNTETTQQVTDANAEPAQTIYQNPDQAASDQANSLGYLTGFISSTVVDGDYLYIYNNISQSLNSGTCQLTLRNGSHTVQASAEIMAMPQTSTCYSLKVPASEVFSGSWDATIDLYSGDLSGQITQTVEIQL